MSHLLGLLRVCHRHGFAAGRLLPPVLSPPRSAPFPSSQQLRSLQFEFRQKPRPRRPPPTSTERSKTTLLYVLSVAVLTAGASYAAVPLYRVFCQSTGFGGTVQKGHDTDKVATMARKRDRSVRIQFTADTAATMRWNFRPQQSEIKVCPGETALAFYTAENPTEQPIDGISTYNVVPYEAGPYFNKIQCFCFEEQRLNPHEEVDMPVFFYLDPDFADDPLMEKVDAITLSYTFFESKPGLNLPFPYANTR